MAQRTFRANLHAKAFPLLARDFGQSVLIGELDGTQDRFVNPDNSFAAAGQTPQAYYMHNVLPTAQGYQSVKYRKIFHDGGGGYNHYINIAELFAFQNTGGWGYASAGRYKNYAAICATHPGGTASKGRYVLTTAQDVSTGSHPWNVPGSVYEQEWFFPFISAYAGGANFLANGTNTLYEYAGSLIFNPGVGTGITGACGVCAAQGYLIYWNGGSVFWSSTTDVRVFTPSLISGAGGGAVSGIKGPIVVCAPTLGGFVAIGFHNSVYFQYTGNTRYPFAAKEIRNGGGVVNFNNATFDADEGVVYVVGNAGIQAISGSQAETIVPEFQSLVLNHTVETYNTTTDEFDYTVTADASKFFTKLAYVANRYLCISVGTYEAALPGGSGLYYNTYDYIYVFDTVLERWGKLKIPHQAVFTYSALADNFLGFRDYIAVLQLNGDCYRVELDINATGDYSAESVLVMGKYQFSRGSMMSLQELELQLVDQSKSLTVTDYYSYDGKQKAGADVGYLAFSGSAGARKYLFDREAYCHSLVLKGDFLLNTAIITGAQGGDA